MFCGCKLKDWHRHLTIFYSKPKFRQIILKTKTVLILLENLHASQFQGKKNEYDNNILRFYI